VTRGCSRGEESCSLYLADPIAIIEVRGEEVLALTLDGDRLWRRVPRLPGVPSCFWEIWVWWDMEIYSLCIAAALENLSLLLVYYFIPLVIGYLKLAYRWWREPIPFLGDNLWVCWIRLGAKVYSWRNPWGGLPCFAQGCLWWRSRMKTWSPSYRYAGFLLIV
jgi:hypothetical protein